MMLVILFNKILVAMDESNPSKIALDYAVNLALDQNAELYVLSVVPQLHPILFNYDQLEFAPDMQEEIIASYEKLARAGGFNNSV